MIIKTYPDLTFNKWQLRPYSSLLNSDYIRETREKIESWFRIRTLWTEFLWEYEWIPGNLHEAQVDLFAFIDRELFPLEGEDLDTRVMSGSDPFDFPVPYMGKGVTWALCLEDWDSSLEVFKPLLFFMPNAVGEHTYWGHDKTHHATQELASIWSSKGYDAIAPYPFDYELDHLPAILKNLPLPHQPLALLHKTIERTHDNPFLDDCGGMDEWSKEAFYWNVDDIVALANYYKAAKPIIKKIEDYEAWYWNGQFSDKQIIELIMKGFQA